MPHLTHFLKSHFVETLSLSLSDSHFSYPFSLASCNAYQQKKDPHQQSFSQRRV